MAKNNGRRDFRVVFSRRLLDRVKDFGTRAQAQGLGEDFSAAWRVILKELEHDPVSFGDPFNHYQQLKLTLYRRIVTPVAIVYAVDDSRRIVYIKSVDQFPPESY